MQIPNPEDNKKIKLDFEKKLPSNPYLNWDEKRKFR